MADTSFVIPPEKAARYARALPNDPDTGRPQSVQPDATQPTRFECGGGCAVSTAGDYLRFAAMLLNRGELDGRRVLARKSAEYMTVNQLAPGVRNLVGAADPTRADLGFAWLDDPETSVDAADRLGTCDLDVGELEPGELDAGDLDTGVEPLPGDATIDQSLDTQPPPTTRSPS